MARPRSGRDGHLGVGPLLADGVDYLVCEALAELTLAILAKDRARDEAAGWTRDLPIYASMVAPEVIAGKTRFITNAGGPAILTTTATYRDPRRQIEMSKLVQTGGAVEMTIPSVRQMRSKAPRQWVATRASEYCEAGRISAMTRPSNCSGDAMVIRRWRNCSNQLADNTRASVEKI